jgi:hypothetical protein
MKDIPAQRKIPCTYHSLVLGYPIPGFLILGYLSLIWDIPGISQNFQKIPLGYPAPGHIPGPAALHLRSLASTCNTLARDTMIVGSPPLAPGCDRQGPTSPAVLRGSIC